MEEVGEHAVDFYWNSDPWYRDDLYVVRFIRGEWLRLYTFGAAVLIGPAE